MEQASQLVKTRTAPADALGLGPGAMTIQARGLPPRPQQRWNQQATVRFAEDTDKDGFPQDRAPTWTFTMGQTMDQTWGQHDGSSRDPGRPGRTSRLLKPGYGALRLRSPGSGSQRIPSQRPGAPFGWPVLLWPARRSRHPMGWTNGGDRTG